MIDQQALQSAYVIHRALRDGLREVEVTEAAEAQWVENIVARSTMFGDFAEQCTPGYYNNEGQPGPASRQNGFFFGGPMEYVEILEQWRADGKMSGLETR
jgi:cyclohexanone monooxygenase